MEMSLTVPPCVSNPTEYTLLPLTGIRISLRGVCDIVLSPNACGTCPATIPRFYGGAAPQTGGREGGRRVRDDVGAKPREKATWPTHRLRGATNPFRRGGHLRSRFPGLAGVLSYGNSYAAFRSDRPYAATLSEDLDRACCIGVPCSSCRPTLRW